MATKKIAPPDSLGRQMNFATGRMNALCQKMLAPYGLTLPQWVILSCLWRHGELTIRELSEAVGAKLPAISRIIDRMVERGLLLRRRDDSDRRVTVIDVTAKGRKLDHLANFYKEINELLLVGFAPEERQQAFDLLGRIEDNARNALK